MNIPLKVESFVTDGNQFLKYWFNSKSETTKAPFQPYFYSREINLNAKCESVNRSLLYDTDYKGNIYKCTVRTTKDLIAARDENSMEANVKFVDRVYIDNPEFLLPYANTDRLKILSLDIETHTYLTFPSAEIDAIIAIGLQLNDSPIQILMAQSYEHDGNILERFVDIISKLDPDVIVTYNGTSFDWPYIVDRMKINKISTTKLTRDGSQIFFKTDRITGEVSEVVIGGRIHYDIYTRSVLKDQNLFKESPKSKDMKTIAKLYGCPDVIKEPKEIMSNMRSITNTDRLKEYLTSDIRCTTFLANIYFPQIVSMAEYLKISLDSCVNMTPSYVGGTIFARVFYNLNIISDKTVGEAYPILAENKQGGYVETFKFGLFKDGIRDLDFISFYPSIIVMLSLDPVTTKIIDMQDKMGPYSTMLTDDNHLRLSIPDYIAMKQIIIDIDRNKRSVMSEFVDTWFNERAELKRQLKSIPRNTPEWYAADSQQLNLKVILNSISGMVGQKYARHGSLASYIAITGTARFILQQLVQQLQGVVAANTDGVYTLDDTPLSEINDWLQDFVHKTFHTNSDRIQLEDSHFDAAYFVQDKEKHYLLLDDDKLVIHGAALKSGRLPNIYTKIIDEIGYKMLTGEVTKKDVASYYDNSDWTLDDIQTGINCKLRKEYKSQNNISIQLLDQYEQRFGQELHSKTKLFYVKVKHGKHVSDHKLVTIFDTIDDIPNIDIEYYKQNVLDKAFIRLGFKDLIPSNAAQTSLFDF